MTKEPHNKLKHAADFTVLFNPFLSMDHTYYRFHLLQNLSFVTLLLCRGLSDFKQNKHAYFCFTRFSFHLWKFMKLLVSIWSAIFNIWKGLSNWKTCSFKYWLLLILNKDDVTINPFHFVGFQTRSSMLSVFGWEKKDEDKNLFSKGNEKIQSFMTKLKKLHHVMQ